MNKKIIILSSIGIIVFVLAMVVGGSYMRKPPIINNDNQAIPQQSQEPITINVKGSDPLEIPEPSHESPDAEDEKSIPQEQENVPVPVKPTEKPKPPQATGSYTDPGAPPVYNEQDTIKETPKETSPPPKERTENGKIYVEGFGYVEIGGPNQGKIVDSDGDINKQVGSMD